MSVNRAKKEASKRLGIALEGRYRDLVLATGEDEVAGAAVELGQCFNDNIEFIIWVLKTHGGLRHLAPEMIRKNLPDISHLN